MPNYKTFATLAVSISLLATLLSGCAPAEQSANEIAADLPPYTDLSNVHLGMSARKLKSVRPVAFAPYAGLQERIGRTLILYHFLTGETESWEWTPIGSLLERIFFKSSSDSLLEVYAITQFGTDSASVDSAQAATLDRYRALVTRAGPPAECVYKRDAKRRAWAAWWRRGKGSFELRFQKLYATDDPTVPRHVAIGESIRLATDSNRLVDGPWQSCPANFPIFSDSA
jgi:hypothetical protein